MNLIKVCFKWIKCMFYLFRLLVGGRCQLFEFYKYKNQNRSDSLNTKSEMFLEYRQVEQRCSGTSHLIREVDGGSTSLCLFVNGCSRTNKVRNICYVHTNLKFRLRTYTILYIKRNRWIKNQVINVQYL